MAGIGQHQSEGVESDAASNALIKRKNESGRVQKVGFIQKKGRVVRERNGRRSYVSMIPTFRLTLKTFDVPATFRVEPGHWQRTRTMLAIDGVGMETGAKGEAKTYSHLPGAYWSFWWWGKIGEDYCRRDVHKAIQQARIQAKEEGARRAAA